mmetsp:Transcript_13103/g.28427  ORF Transcript_13103/g.28427 Transcript_13103/m.28427 type:complete len:227 (+) Transcript_13103:80-760(+)
MFPQRTCIIPKMMVSAARRSARHPSIVQVSSIASRHFSTTTGISGSNGSFKDHKLNCSKALKKADEGRLFGDLAGDQVSTLEGIGPDRAEALSSIGIHTIKDLATNKYFHIARAIETMSKTEVAGDRPAESIMNIDDGVDKEYHSKSLQEIVEAPVSALLGIGDKKTEAWKHMSVITVGDLANLKYCHWAESLVVLGGFEGKVDQTVDEAATVNSDSDSAAGKDSK